MKKKIKYRSAGNDFSVTFFVAVFSCIIGAAVSLELFRLSFSKALSKLVENPIAEVTFRKKNAQRKFLGRNLWDRLRQHSEIYNGDTIHTSSLSEATLLFSDGNVMELSENTMAQVFLSRNEELVAELKEGEAFFDSTNGKSGLRVSSGNESLIVEKGSEISAVRGKNDFSVLIGNGNVLTEDGTLIGADNFVKLEDGKIFQSEVECINPRQNSKILFHDNGTCGVHFKWNAGERNKNGIFLVVSEDRKFNRILSKTDVSGLNEIEISLDNGIYYWKILHDDVESPVMKFHVIKSPAPMLLSPDSEMEFFYRRKNPTVRFIWTESPNASSYRLMVADNPKMKNPAVNQTVSSLSAVITTLPEGKWWWKVDPFYSVNRTGFVENVKTQCFHISKKGKLSSPVLLVPGDDSSIDIESDGNKILFSWKNDPECISYKLRISENEDFTSSVYEGSFTENFGQLDLNDTMLHEGRYWWSVIAVDSEGNMSSENNSAVFHAVKGKITQHLIEPSRGYTISKSLLRDTRFTWKKNSGDLWETDFQVSSEASFSNLVHEEKNVLNSAVVPSLKSGKYWWRIISKNRETKEIQKTPEREVNVTDNLAAPSIIYPTEKIVVRDGMKNEFVWDAVDGADFYKVMIYDCENNDVIFDENVYGNKMEFKMYDSSQWIDRHFYRLMIQGKAMAVPGVSTRRIGDVSEVKFQMLKLRPVEILEPLDNIEISGMDAAYKRIYSKWYAVDDVASAQLVLYKVSGNTKTVVMKNPSDIDFVNGNTVASESVLLDVPGGLKSGKYEIVVYAKTLDGIDISNTLAKNRGHFTIKPIDPLTAADDLNVVPELFDASFIEKSGNRKIVSFSWNIVQDATDYIFRVYNSRNKLLIDRIIEETETTIDFDTMSNSLKIDLMNGTYIWTVEAIRRIDSDGDGKLDRILQPATKAKSMFRTSIPQPGASRATGAENPYGR